MTVTLGHASATLGVDPAVDQARRTAWQTVAILLALCIPTLIAHNLDERLLNGVSVWDKPLKFEFSLALHMITMALLLGVLAPPYRDSRLLRWSMIAAAFATIAEILYIVLQAARGRASHFNASSPIESFAYSVMGIGAVTIIAGSFILGLAIWRDRGSAVPSGLRLGAGLGLTLGAVATFITAGYMASLQGHWVGGLPTDAKGLSLFGWSTMAGDLRVPHFFATHAMQGLPFVGWLADRILPMRLAPVAVVIATVAWAAVVLATFLQALAGQPFWPL